MVRCWAYRFCMIFTAAFGIAGARADDATKPADHFTLIREMREQRSQLLRGAFHGKGHQIFAAKSEGADGETDSPRSDFKFDVEFDFAEKVFRSDREIPVVEEDPKTGRPTVRLVSHRYLRDGDPELYVAVLGDLARARDFPLKPVSAVNRPDPAAMPWDVRTFGLGDWASIERAWTIQNWNDAFDSSTVVNAVEESDGRCAVTSQPKNPTIQVKLWINPKRGHTAERLEVRRMDIETKAWGEPVIVTETKWEERNHVWVPTWMKLERDFRGPESWEATIDWDRVNE